MPRDNDAISITTGPIPGSKKVYKEGTNGIRVPFREVVLEKSTLLSFIINIILWIHISD